MKGARRGIRVSLIVLVLAGAGYGSLHWYIRRSAEETLAAAEAHLRRRENAEAREELQWLLWSDPTHHRALLIRGVSLNADRRFPEAIRTLAQIPENSESSEAAGIALASSLILDGQFERAEDVLRNHVERFPQSLNTGRRLAKLYLIQLDPRKGAAVLLEHWKRNRDELSILPDLLDIEARSITPQEHVERLEAADRSHPQQSSVVLALARAYHQMGMPDRAKERFDSAIRLSPDDLPTKIAATEFLLDVGDLESAQSLLPTDIDEQIHDSLYADRYWYVVARIAESRGQIADALNSLEKAIALRPDNESYLLMQASLLRRLGRREESKRAAEVAAELAATRARLFVLANEINRESPRSEHCSEIATLMERLGHSEQAADWRRVGEAISAASRQHVFP